MHFFSSSKSYPLLLSVSFISGIGLASLIPGEALSQDLSWFALAALTAVSCFFFSGHSASKLALFAGLFLFLGIWRYSLTIPDINAGHIAYHNDRKVVFSGRVARYPDIYREGINLYLDGIEVDTGTGAKKVGGRVLVKAALYPRYSYGDRLIVECKLARPKNFDDFAYDRYLERYGVYSICRFPKIRMAEVQERYFLTDGIFRLKKRFEKTINRGLTEPQASIAQAFVLGNAKAMDRDTNEMFAKSGLSHVIAISGSHISILAACSLSVFLALGFWRKQAIAATLLFISAYLVMTGLAASALRSGIMAMMALSAMAAGRQSQAMRMLVLAAVVMIAVNPRILSEDIGFQLSFMAIIGMIYVAPFFGKGMARYAFFRRSRNLSDAAANSAAAIIVTLPVIIYNFGIVSLVALFANIIIAGLSPFLTICLFISTLAGTLLPFLSELIFFPAQIALTLLIYVAKFSANLPFAYLYVPAGWRSLCAIVSFSAVLYLLKKSLILDKKY